MTRPRSPSNTDIGAGDGIEQQPAGIENHDLFIDLAIIRHRQLLGDAGAAEGNIDEIISGSELEGRSAATRTGDQRQLAVISSNRAEYIPGKPVFNRRAIGRQFGFQRDITQAHAFLSRTRRDERVELRHFGRGFKLLEFLEGILGGSAKRRQHQGKSKADPCKRQNARHPVREPIDF
jgi:hypothetical protein